MSTLETVDIPGVDILAVGGPYLGTGSAPGGDYYTLDDLKLLAANARELAGEITMPVKLGHSAEQKLLRESGLFDEHGQPAAGWLENIRVQGDKLYADAKNVPAKLAALIKAGAFRNRSLEQRKYIGQRAHNTGKDYGWVIDGLALLGGKAPAVRTLDDIVALYSSDGDLPELGDDVPEGVRTVTFAAASIPGGDMPDSLTLTPEQTAAVAKHLGVEKPADLAPEKLLAAIESATKTAVDAVAEKAKTELDAAKKLAADAEAELKTLKAAAGATGDEGAKELAATLKKLAADAEQGVKASEDLRVMRRDSLINEALRAKKIKPAEVKEYQADYDVSPETVERVLARLKPDPLQTKVFGADGDGGSDDEQTDDEKAQEEALTRHLQAGLGTMREAVAS